MVKIYEQSIIIAGTPRHMAQAVAEACCKFSYKVSNYLNNTTLTWLFESEDEDARDYVDIELLEKLGCEVVEVKD